MKKLRFAHVLLAALLPLGAGAQVTLVQTNSPGYYNNKIGNLLNLSNTGFDTCAEPFPVANDCSATYATAPNLSTASSVLGNWLTDPANLNSNWASFSSIPNSWAVGTEVGIIYQFNTLSATNVVAKFGVDNGIFAWLDGKYLLGRRDPGGVVLGEYTLNLGDLAAGTHFLQLLVEDHGVTNGYAVQITADTFVPAPQGVVPEPASLAMTGFGLFGLLAVSKRRRVS